MECSTRDRERRSASGSRRARCPRHARLVDYRPLSPPACRSTPSRREFLLSLCSTRRPNPRVNRQSSASSNDGGDLRSTPRARGEVRRAARWRQESLARPAPPARRAPHLPRHPSDRRPEQGREACSPAATCRAASPRSRRRRRVAPRGPPPGRLLGELVLCHRAYSVLSRFRASWTFRRAASSLVPITTEISA